MSIVGQSLAVTGVTKFSYFMVLPFLPIYLIHLGYSPSEVGLIVAGVTAASRFLPLIGGYLAEVLGTFGAVRLGLFLLALGNLGLLLSSEPTFAAIVIFFIGTGIAFVKPSLQGSMAANQSSEQAHLNFSKYNLVVNAVSVSGPVLGSFLFSQDPRYLFSAAIILYVGAIALAQYFSGSAGIAQTTSLTNYLRKPVATTLSPKYFAMHLQNVIFWALYSQIYIFMPIFMEKHLNLGDRTGYVFGAGAVVVVLFQLPISKLVAQVSTSYRKSAGFLLVALGLVTFAFADSLALLFPAIALMALGELIYMPAALTQIAKIATHYRLSTTSILSVSVAILSFGDVVGSVSSTTFIDTVTYSEIWLSLAAVGFFGAAASMASPLFRVYIARLPMRRAGKV